MTIKVLLVDDQNLVKMGICSLLQLSGRIDVVAQLDNGLQVVKTIETLQPDVMLLDIRMPKMNGIEVLTEMKEKAVSLPTIILTTFDEHDLILESIKLGAKGYLRKDVSLDLLMNAIDTVIAGDMCIQPGLADEVKANIDLDTFNHELALANKTEVQEYEALTNSEVQILQLAAEGHSNNEIAAAIHKSPGTVRNQMSFIFAKLHVRDRTRAVLKAIEHGLI